MSGFSPPLERCYQLALLPTFSWILPSPYDPIWLAVAVLSDSGSSVLHLPSYRCKRLSRLPFHPAALASGSVGEGKAVTRRLPFRRARVHGTKNTQRGQHSHCAR